jgi:hypothetical protein
MGGPEEGSSVNSKRVSFKLQWGRLGKGVLISFFFGFLIFYSVFLAPYSPFPPSSEPPITINKSFQPFTTDGGGGPSRGRGLYVLGITQN